MNKFRVPYLLTASFLLIITNFLTAQSFSGEITYRIKSSISFDQETENEEVNTILTTLEKESKNSNDIKLKLIVDDNKSLSFFENVVEMEGDAKLNVVSMKARSWKCFYTNLIDGKILAQKFILGKMFIITHNLNDYEWKLEEESKLIGNYVCKKATMIESNNYKKTNKIVEAWYAPSLPVYTGPVGYGGLPGLILEINDGKNLTYLVEKISFDLSTDKKIEQPSKGKVLTKEEYENLLTEVLQNKLKNVDRN